MNYNIDDIVEKLSLNKETINYYVDCIGKKYHHFDKLNNAGIYVFWYHNINKKLFGLNRSLIVDGPSRKKQNIVWDWNLEDEFVCLYIGRTSNLKKRIGLHLLLNTDNLKNKNGTQLNKISTSCQLRSGFDYLYSEDVNVYIKNEMMEHLFLSLYLEKDFIKRFYLENHLIGKLKPWFNVDSER